MADVISEAVACQFCGHRYLRPCASLTIAMNCGNYAYMTSAGSVGRINAPIVTAEMAEALRIADEFNHKLRVNK